MHQQRRFRIAVSLLVCILLHAEGADKYTDENRPYEFGFNVEIGGNKQQHRHEKKDKDGIIMGEFGFVTADDVYHVTVYATDKEGRFKILSMKNIHLKSSPVPAGPALSTRQGHSLAISPPAQSTPAASPKTQANIIPQAGPVSQAKTPFKPIVIQPPARSCSSCSLPTTTPRAPPVAPPTNFVPQNQQGFPPPPTGFVPQNQPSLPSSLPASFVPQNQQGFPATPTGFVPQNQHGFPPTQPAGLPPQSQQSFPPTQPAGLHPQNQQSFPPTQPAGLPPQSQQSFPAPPSVSFAPQNQPSFPASPPVNFVPQNQPNFPPASSVLTNQAQPGGFFSQPSGSQAGQPSYPQSLHIAPASAPLRPPSVSQQKYPSSPSSVPNAPNNYAQPGFEQSPAIGSRSGVPQSFSDEQLGQPQYSVGGSPAQSSNPQDGPGSRISKQYTGPEQQFGSNPRGSGPVKPTLVSAQMQIVDKDTDIHALRPGEKQGLPPGLSNNDMTQLLYTFNYTVGFHGHFEEGYRNGAKKGYYFVTGRNGVRTRIDYTADETGFHPRVSQEVLDLLSDDVPKPETEKDEKYGLKGYEFKWLYYPPDQRNAR